MSLGSDPGTVVVVPTAEPSSVPPATATATSPTGRQLWRSARGPLAVALVVVLVALLIAALSSGHRIGFLDPDSVAGNGSRAVAQLLRAQGADVVRAAGVAEAGVAAGRGDTLVLSQPDLLTVEQARELASTRADLVVVGATRQDLVTALASDLTVHGAGQPEIRSPVCELPAAIRAGDALTGGTTYAVGVDAVDTVGCYPVGGDPTVVETRHDGQRVVFVGSPGPLENDHLAEAGNAALVLGLLGQRSTVVWQVPSPLDFPSEEGKGLSELAPTWVKVLVLQVFLAVVLMALWRARRLGPVVPEALPVVVRAAEATEGRGRLYRRAGGRDVAAERLRAGTRRRLAATSGLPRHPTPESLVEAVAARTARTAPDVHGLLYGGPPTDDGALVRLAADLDVLERQVRRP